MLEIYDEIVYNKYTVRHGDRDVFYLSSLYTLRHSKYDEYGLCHETL